MQAIGTMLDREIYESNLRSEAIMSIILEIKIIEKQDGVQNKINNLRARQQ